MVNVNPQIEDGYTQIVNEVMDAFCRFRIPGEVRQVVDVILRKTYGWHKKTDSIALATFVEMTGMQKPNVARAIKKAVDHKIVIKSDNAPLSEVITTYQFNKYYDQWVPFVIKSDNDTVIKSDNAPLSEVITNVIKSDNKSLSKVIPSKEKKNKRNIYIQRSVIKSDNNPPPCPYDEIIKEFNSLCPSLPPVETLTHRRMRDMEDRWVEAKRDLEIFRKIFKKVEESDYLSGRIRGRENTWKCTFDWLIKDNDAWVRVLEGNYDNDKKKEEPKPYYRRNIVE